MNQIKYNKLNGVIVILTNHNRNNLINKDKGTSCSKTVYYNKIWNKITTAMI